MELFSEIYNLYYRAVETVLRQAQERPLSANEVQGILAKSAFSESALSMLPKLQSGIWPLLSQTEQGYTATCVPLKNNPLTILQQAWIRAVLDDARIHLFLDEGEIEKLQAALSVTEPLYRYADFYLFDKATDNDNYESLEYRKNFRLFLSAIRGKTSLRVQYEGGKGHRVNGVFWPYKLEYSQKDDKFRAYCYRKGDRRRILNILNLGRVIFSEATSDAAPESSENMLGFLPPRYSQVVIEITRERNALERCMVHFAHFEKRTEYDELSDRYICTIRYNVMEETEVVIRVLSFGPTIKVLEPVEFVNEIKNRVRKQTELMRIQKENTPKDEQ